MTALVVAESVALGLLALLVLGLLRSHAEILRRLEALQGERAGGRGEGTGVALDDALPRPVVRADAPAAHDVVGRTPFGETVQIGLRPGGQSTILAFLTTGCSLCHGLWEGLRTEAAVPVPGGARIVAVTRDSRLESPGRLRELARPGLPVVMSSSAWEGYDVPGAPYFVYVDGASGQVHGEGSATSWAQVASLLADALLDADAGPAPGVGAPVPSGAPARQWRSDQELAAAGIVPDDPSLYPDGRRGGDGRPSPGAA